MCVTSMITQHYMQQFPQPLTFPVFEWPNYQELLRKAKLYDEMTGQKDCPDDAKTQWALELERVLKDRYGLTPEPTSEAG